MMGACKTLIWALALGACSALHAVEGELIGIKPLSAEKRVLDHTPAELIASLQFQHGKITLPNGIATLDLPPQYQYLAPADANTLLGAVWGNPVSKMTQGLIVSADHSLLGPGGWAMVISYKADGHVRETDAAQLQYDEILKDLQKKTDEQSAARYKKGYNSISLLGWADQPSYNPATHQYVLAKEIAVLGNDETTLNYNIRMLSRSGVLDLNAVAPMRDFYRVKIQAHQLAALTRFTPTHGYADFDAKHDAIAGYTVTDMVTGYVSRFDGLGQFWTTLKALKYAVLTALLTLGLAVAGFIYSLRRIRSSRVYLR